VEHDDLSPTERRLQIALSTVFCISVTVFGAFLVVIGIIQWAGGEVIPIGGVAIILLGAVFGYWLGIRPLWNQFVAPRL
jgi:hypothetical protein